jgi:hypothetical protein
MEFGLVGVWVTVGVLNFMPGLGSVSTVLQQLGARNKARGLLSQSIRCQLKAPAGLAWDHPVLPAIHTAPVF